MPPKPVVITALWRGPSSQPPWQRLNGQVESATNVRFDVTFGAVKRNPTEFLARLLDGTSPIRPAPDEYVWIGIRGAIVAIGEDEVLAWDEAGNSLTIVDETDLTAGPFNAYLRSPDSQSFVPLSDLDIDVAEDTVVVANRRVQVRTLNSFTPDEALNMIINGDPDISSGSPGASEFGTASFDDFQALLDASPQPTDGEFTRVSFDSNLDPAGRYIKWDGLVHPNNIFPEHDADFFRIPPAQATDGRYDATTMPLLVVFDEENATVFVREAPWRQRLAGNAATNIALLKDEFIRTVTFLDGRLFLLTDRTINSSRLRSFFELWLNSTAIKVEGDRMAQDAAFSRLGRLLRSAVCGRNLFMMAERGQIEMGSGRESLSDATVQQRVLTDFKAQDLAPASGPETVTFIDHSFDVQTYEWGGTGAGIVYRGSLNIHEPDLFHNTAIETIAIVRSATFITIRSANMKVHHSFRVGSNLIQSAWSEFDMQGVPVFIDEWEGNARIITRDSDGYTMLNYAHRSPVRPVDMPFLPRMDEQEIIQGVYDSQNDETSFTHTGRNGDLADSRVVIRSPGKQGAFLVPKEIDSAGRVIVAGQWDDVPQYLGFVWNTELVLSALHAGPTATLVMMSELAVFHHESTDYHLLITIPGSTTLIQGDFQGVTFGEYVVGGSTVETGFKRFDVGGDARKLVLTLNSRTPGQVSWNSLEYLAEISGRTQ